MSLKDRLISIQEVLLCAVRKWWRPATCVGLAASVWVNLVIIPWRNGKPIEFTPAAAFVGAITAAFAVREVGKAWGTADK